MLFVMEDKEVKRHSRNTQREQVAIQTVQAGFRWSPGHMSGRGGTRLERQAHAMSGRSDMIL